MYDGWETRARGRELPGGTTGSIVRLGVPGVVRAIVVDTAFFTGNFPQACSVEACSVTGYPASGGARAAPTGPSSCRACR